MQPTVPRQYLSRTGYRFSGYILFCVSGELQARRRKLEANHSGEPLLPIKVASVRNVRPRIPVSVTVIGRFHRLLCGIAQSTSRLHPADVAGGHVATLAGCVPAPRSHCEFLGRRSAVFC